MLKMIAILFVLWLPSLLVGQIKLPSEACNLELADSPAIRGLRLGMSPPDSERALGMKVPLLKKTEVSYFFENLGAKSVKASSMHTIEVDAGVQQFVYDASKTKTILASLTGVDGLLLGFYDDKLYTIYIRYAESGIKWKDSIEFAQILSEKFNFPKQSWRYSDEFNASYLFCSGFSLSARASNNKPTILLADKKIQSEVDAKQKKLISDEEQRIKDAALETKRRFKP